MRLAGRGPEHGIREHVRRVSILHATVVVTGATGEVVHEEETLQHGLHVSIAHQRSGNPDLTVKGHVVPAGEGFDLFVDTVVLAEMRQVDPFSVPRSVADRINQTGAALLRQSERLAVHAVKAGRIQKRGDFENLNPHCADDGPRVLVQNASGAAGKLDAVPVHYERDGRAVYVRGVEAVQRLARDPSGVSAMGDNPASVAVRAAFAQRVANRNGNHHAQASAVHLRASRQPGNVAGKIQTAAKVGNDVVRIHKSDGGKRGEIPDAGVGVFNGVFDSLEVDHGKGEQQWRNQADAAAQVIRLADFGQGRQ